MRTNMEIFVTQLNFQVHVWTPVGQFLVRFIATKFWINFTLICSLLAEVSHDEAFLIFASSWETSASREPNLYPSIVTAAHLL